MGEWLRQERERVLREQQETAPDVRLRPAQAPPPDLPPQDETPCFPIERIRLDGEDAHRFLWSLKAANPRNDPRQRHQEPRRVQGQ